MRTVNSAKNIATGIVITLTLTVLGFFTRKIFLDTLGSEYLGLNGLLGNIIGMLSLVESGIGVSIVYNLYKPLADNDQPHIIALVQLYRTIYRYIALAMIILAVCFYPFLGFFIKGGENLSYISVVYSIFVANTVVGYLMAHKYSLINSDQKQYKLAGYNLSYQIGLYLVKIAILYYLKNYILFLACEFFFNVGYNLLVVKKVNSLYPYITTKKRYTIDADTRRNIVKNVKALFLYSIGGYLLHSTDNLLISSFVGISIVGLYSNYTLIINQLKTLANQVFTGLKDSVGNLVASECPVRRLQVFNALYLMNFLIVSLIVIVLYNTLNPFVMWWLGGEYVLPDSILIVACMNLYIDMIRSSIMVYKTVSGIFDADKYVVLITAAINLAASLLLVKDYGLLGILLGTFISIILTASWNWPRLVYKYTFKRSPLEYYLKFVLYALVTIALCAVTRGLNDAILHADAGINIWNICLRGLVSLALTILAYFVIFHRTPSYKYLENSITQLIKSRYGK